ncbi:MAG: ABC transporter permease [Desulfobulbaceae bacterium]|nr:ABC transporter permease [Desulfobulbaceae bacterium]
MKEISITLKLAFRNLARNRRRSLLTITAIAFALACLLIFDALKNGLHQKMVDTTTSTDIGSLQIHGQGYGVNLISLTELPKPDEVANTLRSMGISTFAKRLKATGLILAGPKSAAVVLHGVIAKEEDRVTVINRRLVQGESPTSGKEVMLGQGLAQAFGLTVGGELTIMAQDIFGTTVTRRFTITGIFQTGVTAFDQGHLFLPLASLQSFLDAPQMISEIALSLPEQDHATEANLLRQSLGSRYQIRTWEEIAPDVTQLIELNDSTMGILIAIVFLIVAMGIINTMTTITFERFREFGTIAALGVTPTGIMRLVTAEAIALGLAGSLIGSAIGLGCCLYLANHGIDLTTVTSANQYFSNNHILKAVMDWRQVLTTNAFTMLTAILAGLPPAWTAARQNPAQALSHL